MAIKFLSAVYRIETEMPSLKCNTWALECIRRRGSEVNDLQGDFSERMELLSPISLPADQMAAFKTLGPSKAGFMRGSQTVLR